MRLLSYRSEQTWRPGIQVGNDVVDAAPLTAALDHPAEVRTTRDVLELGPTALAQLASMASSASPVGGVDELELGPPVTDPQKIICLGLNYRDHATEAGLQEPSAPIFFAKFANSLAGPTATIVPPATTTKVDYEAELAVVIGRPGRDIPPASALDHVAGAMAFNDVSARDLQMANQLWTGGKAIDTFAPCGPALVTLDELGDLDALGLRTRVNGDLVQDGHTASMIFGVAETISFLSQIMTLEVGDIIATATPAGVGASRTPPLFLEPGDIVEVEVDRIGTLRNPVGPPIAKPGRAPKSCGIRPPTAGRGRDQDPETSGLRSKQGTDDDGRADQMGEIDELTQLVLHERQGRDRGWWQQMLDCFYPGARIRLSWFEGTAEAFVAESQAMGERGDHATHRLGPPVVHVRGDRAIVELPMTVDLRIELDGVEADLASTGRLLYRAESRDGGWRIVGIDAIYQRDSLVPSVPGTQLTIAPEELAGLRASYRLLSYCLTRRGYTVDATLYGDDRPDEVAELYDSAFGWAGVSQSASAGRAP